MVAGRLWGGCSVLPGMLTVFPKELMPGDPCVLDPPFGVNIHRVGWGKVLSSLSLPSTRPRGPFKEQGRGGPAIHEKVHSVPASLQPGLGWRGQRAGRGHCPRSEREDSVVYSWAMLLSPRPRHVAVFLVLVNCPLGLGGPRIIHHLIRRKWLARQGDRVTQSLDWPTGTPVQLGECDPLSYPLPHGDLGGSLLETSSN